MNEVIAIIAIILASIGFYILGVMSDVTIPAVHGKPITVDYVLRESLAWLEHLMDKLSDDDKPATQTRIDLIKSMIEARGDRR